MTAYGFGGNITGTISEQNSSIVSLSAGATFTGESQNVTGFPSVVLAVKTDQNGTLYAEFSPDGTNWDSSISYTCLANENEVHKLAVTRKFFRVRFTNTSAVPQTYFRLQTLFGSQGQLTSPSNSIIQSDADALVTRPLDFNLMVASNLYQNRIAVFKDGLNSDIDTGTVPEDVWDAGGVYTGFPVGTIEELQVFSSDPADTGTLYFAYLASETSTAYITTSVQLNGTTVVNTGINVWRCNFAFYDTGNDTTFNVGTITLRHRTTTANVFCTIAIGRSQSFCAAYTVPFGCTAYIDRLTGTIKSNATGTLDGFLWYRTFGLSPRLRQSFTIDFGALYFDDIDYLFAIPARTDLIPRVTAVSANNIGTQISYRIILTTN